MSLDHQQPPLHFLSYNQNQLWYLEKLNPQTKINIVHTALKISGKLEISIFEKTLNEIVTRHENLRAKFVEIEGVGYQTIEETLPEQRKLPRLGRRRQSQGCKWTDSPLNSALRDGAKAQSNLFKFVDLSEFDPKIKNEKIDAILENERNLGFDLSVGPLFRFNLCKLEEERHIFLITIHHLIMDAWSIDLIAYEIGVIYEAYRCDREIDLPSIESKYTDYATLQKQEVSGKFLKKRLSYWEKMLDNAPAMLQWPNSSSFIHHRKEKCHSYNFSISNELFQKLKALANENHTTLFVIICSALFVLYSRYHHLTKDILLGIPFANRGKKKFQNVFGFFVNTLPMRIDVGDCHNFIEVIEKVRVKILGALLNQELPFPLLVEEMKPARNPFRNPFFQTVVNHIDLSKPNYQSPHLVIQREFIPNAASIFDLIISIVEHKNECCLNFDYPLDLFDASKTEQIAVHFNQLLNSICKNPQLPPQKYDILTESEKIFLLEHSLNKTYHLDSRAIPEIFYEQAGISPKNIAIIYEDKEVTYTDLNKQSNQFARFLLENDLIEREALIAVCMEKSLYLPICLLGIVKIGAAYVPIDPSYPDERIAYILKDTKVRVILVDAANLEKIKNINGLRINSLKNKEFEKEPRIIAIDHLETLNAITRQPVENIENLSTKDHLACVLYTSGTTGRPKGVMIEQKGIVSLIKNIDYIDITPSDSFIQLSNICFDASTLEIWGALLNSSKLYIPQNSSILGSLQNLLKENKISILILTKSLFDQLFLYDSSLFNGVQWLVIGGESLNRSFILQLANSKRSPAHILNAYGPTENSTISTVFEVNRGSLDNLKSVPIGKPIANRNAYILDHDLTLLPVGTIGELYVGGEGISRGYLNQIELTSEKFVSNPFQTEEEKKKSINSRLYKTGDLARLLPDGHLLYVGRIDSQIKIRGFRIELKEIEHVMLAHPKIRHAIVVYKKTEESGIGFLVGYYIAKKPIDASEFLRYLSTKLPEYMLPQELISLKEIPLTPNGKLDTTALPAPSIPYPDSRVRSKNILERTAQRNLGYRNGKAPSSKEEPLQTELLKEMGEILRIPHEQIDMKEDFFSLGGNSISAIRLVSKLSKILKKQVPLSLIFEARTPEKILENLLTRSKREKRIPQFSVPLKAQKVSFAQERLLFIEEYESGSNIYNMPLNFKILKPLQIEVLEKGLQAVMERHETLRTTVRKDENGSYYLNVLPNLSNCPMIQKVNAAKERLQEVFNEHQGHIFDLYREIPLKVMLIEVFDSKGQKENYLSIVVHHIAFDGWSIDIFLKEWGSYYEHFLNPSEKLNINLDLASLPIQYKDFALWQRKYLSGSKLKKNLDFWKSELYSFETLHLLTDFLRPTLVEYKGDEIQFKVESSLSKTIKILSKQLNVSLHTLLFSAYLLILRIYSGQDDLIVGILAADRELPQITNLIGFFVNTLPIRIKFFAQTTLAAFIKQVNKQLLMAYEHKDLPFEKLVSELRLPNDTSRHPLFQVLFAFQNFEESSWDGWLQKIDSSKFFKIAKFDLTLLIEEKDSEIEGCFNFSTSLFTKKTVEGYIETYFVVLKQFQGILTNPSFSVEDLNYLSEARYDEVCHKWNETDCHLSLKSTIPQIFEEQVKKTPQNIALEYKNDSFTYAELNKEANCLASYITSLSLVEPDSLIALLLPRDEKILISILGVLKSGAAYVPIDIEYPDERIIYMLKDANIEIVLTNSKLSVRLLFLKEAYSLHSLQIIVIENIKKKNALSKAPKKPRSALSAHNLAYVIYTSGTTGNPKGIMIEHRSYIAAILGFRAKHFFASKELTTYSMTNYVFDIFGLEYGLPLFTGGKIVLGEKSLEKIDCRSFDFIQMTPSLCKLIMDRFIHSDSTQWIIGGEVLDRGLLKSLLSQNLQVINAYGPSETTIWSTSKSYMQNEKGSFERSNIGAALPNEKIYVLNQQLKPVPIGAPGELYISGQGIARGYLNLQELTLKRFVKNPFEDLPPQGGGLSAPIMGGKFLSMKWTNSSLDSALKDRTQSELLVQNKKEKQRGLNKVIYKTGDIVRWLPKGELEYIGRNDFQIKISGYRIELQEIQNIISSYKGIERCVVLAKPISRHERDLSLICYYTASCSIPDELLQNFLAPKLPSYMIPKIYIYLDRFPMTANGKLDEKALPNPAEVDSSVMINKQMTINMSQAINAHLIEEWAKALRMPKNEIRVDHNFFNLGGNSLLAAKIINKLKSSFYPNLTLKDFFIYPTIGSLSKHLLEQSDQEIHQHIEIKKQTIEFITKKIKECKNDEFHDLNPFIILNSNGSHPPLFLFPPGSGGIESYFNNIAKFLNGQKLILFENIHHYIYQKFGEKQSNLFSVEEFAQIYVYLIKSISPKGPYHFFGWSFGGVLALEVAKQLSEDQQQVKNLFLVDPLFYLKDAITELCPKKMEALRSAQIEPEDMNLKYIPSFAQKKSSPDVILFKPIKAVERDFVFPAGTKMSNKIQRQIFKYYAEKAKYNQMDRFLSREQIRLIPLLHHHFSWIEDQAEVEKICALIRDCLSSNVLDRLVNFPDDFLSNSGG